MEFKPLGKNGIDTSKERLRLAPDCSIAKCPASKMGRCIRIGECLMEGVSNETISNKSN